MVLKDNSALFLLDTNIFLEILLDQEKRSQAEKFISSTPISKLYISRFSLYSIGVILNRKNLLNVYKQFIEELIEKINLASLDLENLKHIDNIKQKYNIDFDDAYQYLIAKKYQLHVVSFDKDFQKTDIPTKSINSA